jgi:hypothetical protein
MHRTMGHTTYFFGLPLVGSHDRQSIAVFVASVGRPFFPSTYSTSPVSHTLSVEDNDGCSGSSTTIELSAPIATVDDPKTERKKAHNSNAC